METTMKFDRVVLIKELNDKFKKVGEVFEVCNILEDSFLLRGAKSKVALGVVSFADFENHFVHEGNFKGWTPWVAFAGYDGQVDAYYRTNRHKTQVRFITDKVRAESSKHKDDEFNLYFGIQLAYLRALNKAHSKKKETYENELKKINSEMADNDRMIQKMVNSLEH